MKYTSLFIILLIALTQATHYASKKLTLQPHPLSKLRFISQKQCGVGQYQLKGACYSCGPGVAQCTDRNNAVLCYDGFFLAGFQENKCKQCAQYVETCESYSQIYKCKPGYTLQDNACVFVSEVPPKTCYAGYFLKDDKCLKCSIGALSCLSETHAITCINGFYLSSFECFQCGPNVEICQSASMPLQCSWGYTLVGDRCEKNQPAQQPQCEAGTFLTDNGCKPCPKGAKYCTSSTVATSCQGGHFLSNGQCLPCGPNAKVCSSSTVSIICDTGYYLNNGQCNSCGYQVESCTSPQNPTSCFQGFYIFKGVCIKEVNQNN